MNCRDADWVALSDCVRRWLLILSEESRGVELSLCHSVAFSVNGQNSSVKPSVDTPMKKSHAACDEEVANVCGHVRFQFDLRLGSEKSYAITNVQGEIPKHSHS